MFFLLEMAQESSLLNKSKIFTLHCSDIPLFKTMVEIVYESAMARPYRRVLFCGDKSIKYLDFVHKSNALAIAMADLGVRRGDRVVILLPNSISAVLAFHSVWKTGAIACPASPSRTGQELMELFHRVRPAVAIVTDLIYDTVRQIQPVDHPFPVIIENVNKLSLLRMDIAWPWKIAENGRNDDTGRHVHRFKELIRKYMGSAPPFINPGPNDLAIWICGRADNGTAADQVFTHGELVNIATRLRNQLADVLMEWEDRMAISEPLYTAGGCVLAMGLAAVNRSSSVIMPDARDLSDCIRHIKKYKPYFILDTGSFISGIMHDPRYNSGKIRLDGLKICVSGALPWEKEIRQQFERSTGAELIDDCDLSGVSMPAHGINNIFKK